MQTAKMAAPQEAWRDGVHQAVVGHSQVRSMVRTVFEPGTKCLVGECLSTSQARTARARVECLRCVGFVWLQSSAYRQSKTLRFLV